MPTLTTRLPTRSAPEQRSPLHAARSYQQRKNDGADKDDDGAVHVLLHKADEEGQDLTGAGGRGGCVRARVRARAAGLVNTSQHVRSVARSVRTVPAMTMVWYTFSASPWPA